MCIPDQDNFKSASAPTHNPPPTTRNPQPTTYNPIIELKHVSKRFGRLIVLDDFSLKIEPGKCLVVIGASGTGKSVLLKHIVGLLRPDSGEVWYEGHRIDTLGERQLMEVRTEFGFLFQMGALFDSMTVAGNVAFPLMEHSEFAKDEIADLVSQKLAMVGLSNTENKMPGQLSGGQRKRVALARAIALSPKIILYDEPTTGLDPIRSDVINELIIKLQGELKVTSIVVTHDMNSALKVADRIVMLHKGKIVFDGTADDIQSTQDEEVRRFVQGEAGDDELAGLRTAAPV